MILVTGASGFIGRHFVSTLRENGLAFAELNSENQGVLKAENFLPFVNYKISSVVHLGAKTFVPESWEKPKDYLDSIVQGTQNVLEFCSRNKAEMIYVSAYVYGSQSQQPISEAATPHPSNPYAAAKLMAEQLCLYYHHYLKVPVHIVRPFNLYGPGQNEKFLIPKLIKGALSESAGIVLENTITRRDYIHVKDFSEVLWALCKSPGVGRVYNAGSGRSHSVREIIGLIETSLGRPIAFADANKIRPQEIMDCVADISRLQQDFGWRPKISLEEGIGLLLKES
jgi:nucleoside-diphosphate-sugar epimerase